MSNGELAQVQIGIDEQVEAIRIGWLRLATAGFDPKDRKTIRDEIASNEECLMDLLERRWGLQRNYT